MVSLVAPSASLLGFYEICGSIIDKKNSFWFDLITVY